MASTVVNNVGALMIVDCPMFNCLDLDVSMFVHIKRLLRCICEIICLAVSRKDRLSILVLYKGSSLSEAF